MFFLLLLCLNFSQNSANKLNVPRVLLPYDPVAKSSYVLSTTGGCYKWASTKEDVVSVEPIEPTSEGCSSRALISAVLKEKRRSNSFISAEEIHSKISLRCDVVVDKIHSIKLVSSARELYLEDAPVPIEVKAQNNQLETFSSLENIAFNWSLSFSNNIFSESVNEHIKIVPFKKSSYQAPLSIKKLEEIGKRGATVLLEGIKTGSFKINSVLDCPKYTEVIQNSLGFSVIVNLKIQPSSDTSLFLSTFLPIKGTVIRYSREHYISFPSPQYYFHVDKENFCELDETQGTIFAKGVGNCVLSIKDRFINDELANYLPSVTISVVEKASIDLFIFSQNNWIFQEGNKYTIYIRLFDSNLKSVYLSENMKISISTDGPIQILKELNEFSFEILAKKKGSATISASLTAVNSLKLHYSITCIKNVSVLSEIILSPEILTFSTTFENSNTFKIKAEGGSGSYIWKTSDESNSFIDQIGKGEVFPSKSQNNFIIQASDALNSRISAKTEIYVLNPIKIELSEKVIEAEVLGSSEVDINLYGFHLDKYIPFSMCEDFPFKIMFEDDSIATFNINVGRRFNSCLTLKVTGIKSGITFITVKVYSLKVVAKVSCFNHLSLTSDSNDSLLILPGSSSSVSAEFGPHDLYVDNYTLQVKPHLMSGEKKMIKLAVTFENEFYTLMITCFNLGDFSIRLYVQNVFLYDAGNKMKDNFIEIKAFCKLPQVLKLVPYHQSSFLRDEISCTVKVRDKLTYLISTSQTVSIHAQFYDKNDIIFRNISNLRLKWNVNTELPPKLYSLKHTPFEDNKELLVQAHTNLFSIIVSAYFHSTSDISFKNFKISSAIYFKVFAPLSPALSHISIFNDDKSDVSVPLLQGSGRFSINATEYLSYAQVGLDVGSNVLKLRPSSQSNFRIKILDVCTRDTAAIDVKISEVHKISFDVFPVIIVKDVICVNVFLQDSEANLISNHTFDIQTNVKNTKILSLKRSTSLFCQELSGNIFFELIAKEIGSTTISFNINLKDNKVISSESKMVDVVSDFDFSPKELTLARGCTFQPSLTHKFPYFFKKTFASKDHNTALVTSSDIILAKEPGHVLLHIYFSYVTPNNKTYKSCVKELFLKVVDVESVAIHSPTNQIIPGSKLPLTIFANSNPSLSPDFFATSIVPSIITWSISKNSAHFIQNNVSAMSYGNDFMKIFKPTLPGEYIVSVDYEYFIFLLEPLANEEEYIKHMSVSSDKLKIVKSLKYSSSITISVISNILIENDFGEYRKLILTPNVHYRPSFNIASDLLNFELIPMSPPNLRSASITSKGIIQTGNLEENFLLFVSTKIWEKKVRNFSILVQVSHVTYFIVNEINDAQLNSRYTLEVSFHNEIGEEFLAVSYAELQLELNRNDFLSLEREGNNMIAITPLHSGQTLVKLSRSIPDVKTGNNFHYFNIFTSIFLHSSPKHISLGQLFCLNSFITGSFDVDHKSVFVDLKSGLGISNVQGIFKVTLSDREKRLTSFLSIRDPVRLYLGPANKVNAENGEFIIYRFIFSTSKLAPDCLFHKLENKFALDSFISKIFSCSIESKRDIKFVESIKAEYDEDAKATVCSLKLKVNTDTLADKLDLTLKVGLVSYPLLASSVQFFVYPSFFILSTNFIDFFLNNKYFALKVKGHPEVIRDLEISGEYSHFIHKLPAVFDSTKRAVIPLKLREDYRCKGTKIGKIALYSSVINETITLPVIIYCFDKDAMIKDESSKSDYGLSSFLQSNLYFSLAILSILLIGLNIYWYKQSEVIYSSNISFKQPIHQVNQNTSGGIHLWSKHGNASRMCDPHNINFLSKSYS